jgi:hypothetical protein
MDSSILQPHSYVVQAQNPSAPTSINYQAVVEAPVVQQGLISNQEALNRIADYLDKTTEFLKNRRLSLS